MSNVIVVTFLALVAVAPVAYLAVMASALQSSDRNTDELAVSGAK